MSYFEDLATRAQKALGRIQKSEGKSIYDLEAVLDYIQESADALYELDPVVCKDCGEFFGSRFDTKFSCDVEQDCSVYKIGDEYICKECGVEAERQRKEDEAVFQYELRRMV